MTNPTAQTFGHPHSLVAETASRLVLAATPRASAGRSSPARA